MPKKSDKPVIPVPYDWSESMAEKYPHVQWDRDSIMISGLPPGWEKIGEELLACINEYVSAEQRKMEDTLICNSKLLTNRCTDRLIQFLKVITFGQINKPLIKLNNRLRINMWWHYVSYYPPKVTIEQIKEKFAGLRVYYTGGDERVEGMINLAESMCSRTCQSTGKPGKVVTISGWSSVLDPKVAEKIVAADKKAKLLSIL